MTPPAEATRARGKGAERAEATPQLDVTYIPPVLFCDAWRELSVGILQGVYDRVGRKLEKLASQAVSRGLSLDSLAPGDTQIFAQLRVLNETYATLSNLAFLEGIIQSFADPTVARISSLVLMSAVLLVRPQGLFKGLTK